MAQEEKQILPLVSFVIASYNAEQYIEKCLLSIEKQSYPKVKIEILVIDGGSGDKTLDIARRFSAKILDNPNRIAEFGKSIGIQEAKGKYIIILDADNEIAQSDWLVKNISALENDSSLLGMDSVFLSKKDDFLVNRYCALLGLEDPVVRQVADLSRNADIERGQGYSVYNIRSGRFPIFGSNGFIWRKSVLESIGGYIPRFDEADFCVFVVDKGYKRIGFVKECGIFHHHLKTVREFLRKRFRRGREFMTRKITPGKEKVALKIIWVDKYSKGRLIWAIFLCLTILYPTYEAIRGYIKDKDMAWFLHPPLSFLTIICYTLVFIRYIGLLKIRK